MSPTAGTNGGKLDDWRVVSSDNNITVLRGREQHNANSIMLSYVIRAPPRLCVKVTQSPESPLHFRAHAFLLSTAAV